MQRNERIHKKRYNSIISAAESLFLERGLADVSISEIADEIGMGRRSLYRYFKTKNALAYQIFRNIYEDICNVQIAELNKQSNGFKLIRNALNSLSVYIDTNPEKIRFMAHFDHYYSITFSETDTSVPASNRIEINTTISGLYKAYTETVIMGIQDKSIRRNISEPAEFAAMAINSWYGLAQRISIYSDIISAESMIADPRNLLALHTDMLLRYLK